MLQEAHALMTKNIDVVVGFVESHNRVDIENLIKGLEIIPRKKYEYSGIAVEELDLDAILARKPEVAIIDELAHTNIPLCRNQKRYADVMEMMLAGINVITAINIQHLESLNDIVYSATNVRVNETVPDSFIAQADQVVNIDLSVEDLLERLKSGNIYAANKIDQALNNFFKLENLSQLRELALREVAERVEVTGKYSQITESKNLIKHDVSSGASDRIMVCFQPENISQKYLIRKASRLAGKLNTDWFVVYVETSKDEPEIMDSKKQRYLYMDIQLAEELGGRFIHLKGKNRYKEWLEFAEKERIKHVVLSVVKCKWWRRLFGVNLMARFIAENKFDIHIISSI